MNTKIRTGLRALVGVLLCAAACSQTGCGPKQKAASKGETSTAVGNILQAELDRASDLPFEPDPAKRPVILSQPAATRRQWMLQALRQGYLATGRTNALWDAKVQAAFEAFADYTRVSTETWPVLQKALAAAVATGCDDPMIQYMRARYRDEARAEEKTALELLRAHDAMLRSKHHPVLKFFAGLRAVQSARAADKATKRTSRAAWTTANLEDIARDTNAPVDEVFEAANLWIEHSGTKAWIEHVTSDLDPILAKNWGQTERWFRFRGRTEMRRAWGDRGGGYANTVTEAGWEGFKEHLDKAEEFLAKSWQMNSNSAETAYLMMRLELGQGRGRSRMETWFNRAMSVDTNFYDAALLMSFYLEPRWHGSDATALAFGRSCVASDNWGGRVPLVLADLHHSLATYHNMSNSPAYWHEPNVWRDVKSSYEKYFKLNPDAVGWRHNYARDAYDCGEYSVFLEQTKLFANGTNHAFFGGQQKFQEMMERASAAPGGQAP